MRAGTSRSSSLHSAEQKAAFSRDRIPSFKNVLIPRKWITRKSSLKFHRFWRSGMKSGIAQTYPHNEWPLPGLQNHYILSEMKQCSQQAGEKQTSVQHHTNWLQPYGAISLGHIMWVTSLHLEYPIRIFNMTETTQINFDIWANC